MRRVVILLFVGLIAAGVSQAGEPILTEGSYWRWHVTCMPPASVGPGGKPVLLAIAKSIRTGMRIDYLTTAPPPSAWVAADHDDSLWPRSRAAWLRGLAFKRFSSSMAALRGKFAVTDPKAVKALALDLTYMGGVVVYLNGAEVFRGHLPPGALKPDTPGEAYPKDVYVDAKGAPIPHYWGRRKRADLKDLKARLAKRVRTSGAVRLPLDKLRKGVNVLAIEMHRSPYDSVAASWFVPEHFGKKASWVPIDLAKISLTATGGGVTPNVSRPKGVQVWTHDRNDRVTALDYGDPNEPLQPVKIVAAKGGTYCGQFVIGSDQPLKGVDVSAGALKSSAGEIPAANVEALFGKMDWGASKYPRWSDGLMAKAPAEVKIERGADGAVLPVLVRVTVPKDARAGDYRGVVAVTIPGREPVNVPVEMTVADWIVPGPKDYRTYMGIYQSPISVALRYGVEEWSEKHWDLLDKSFALLARVGNKFANIDLVDQTQFGNDHGMVRFIRKADGTYDYDFSVVDRYLKMVLKHCGKPDYVAVQVWHSGGWSHRPVDTKCTVTVIDPKTKKKEHVQVPVFGSAESKAFWKPVLAALAARLDKLGLKDRMCIGILSDSTAPAPVFTLFDEVIPGGAKWMRGCHSTARYNKPYRAHKAGGTVVLHEHCYGMSMVPATIAKLPPVWSYRGGPATAYFRVAGHETATTLVAYRTMAGRALWTRKQGLGRICLDFWPVLKSKSSRRKTDVYNRYPHSSCAQREPSLKKLTWPGPGGAATTMRYEALVESVQEAEAIIAISEAVDKHADKLGAELAAACRKVLRDHLNYCHTRHQMKWAHVYFHMNHHGWRDISRRLFDCAAQVSKKLGK
jgi:glycosyl hydrolase family 123